MKPHRIFSTLVIVLAMQTGAFAWGDLGHAAIGEVAQEHLSRKARKALSEYLGGLPLSAIASDADKYRNVWAMDLGFVPSNPEFARKYTPDFDSSLPANYSPWSHSCTVGEDFRPLESDNLDGAYVDNIAYYVELLAAKLKKEGKTMDPEERYRAICLITHFLGDMHCPVHIIYQGVNETKGKFKVTYNGKTSNYHTFWDGRIFAFDGWSYLELAYAVDTATNREIREITAGDVRDWAEDSARKCLVVYDWAHPGDVLPYTFPYDARPLLYSQLRNAGYRLAAIFNEIFE